jgi:serine/threonine protein kinase
VSSTSLLQHSVKSDVPIMIAPKLSATVSPPKPIQKPAETVASKPRVRESIRLSDLTRIRILGVGAFGRVYLVRHEPTGKAYALKEMLKKRLILCKQTNNVISEKKVLQSVRHPFLLGLVTTFRDDTKLYMLTELVQGGELFSVLTRNDKLKPPAAKFYGACVVAAIEALHLGGYLYRDLKPENILIDSTGYCKLVDFGFAKKADGRTYTLCGTPEYMAPELVLGKGYDRSADYWAIGILLYEMLVGRTPFADPSGECNKLVICQNIVRCVVVGWRCAVEGQSIACVCVCFQR